MTLGIALFDILTSIASLKIGRRVEIGLKNCSYGTQYFTARLKFFWNAYFEEYFNLQLRFHCNSQIRNNN
jgi:hypothetical protein